MPKKMYPKETVLKAAILVAKRTGLDRLSIREIARELGTSVSPVYDSFESKEDIISAIIENIWENEQVNTSYFKRNEELIIFGLKYPELYLDIRKYAHKMKSFNSNYDNILDLMKSESKLESFTTPELESINFDILIYISGLISRVNTKPRVDNTIFIKYLKQATEVLILGYKNAR